MQDEMICTSLFKWRYHTVSENAAHTTVRFNNNKNLSVCVCERERERE